MGRKRQKLGHLSIQIHCTVDAEPEGRQLMKNINRLLFPDRIFLETPREGEQVYSTFTLRLW